MPDDGDTKSGAVPDFTGLDVATIDQLIGKLCERSRGIVVVMNVPSRKDKEAVDVVVQFHGCTFVDAIGMVAFAERRIYDKACGKGGVNP